MLLGVCHHCVDAMSDVSCRLLAAFDWCCGGWQMEGNLALFYEQLGNSSQSSAFSQAAVRRQQAMNAVMLDADEGRPWPPPVSCGLLSL